MEFLCSQDWRSAWGEQLKQMLACNSQCASDGRFN